MKYPPEIQDLIDRIPPRWGRNISTDRGWDDILIRLQRDLVALDPNFVVYQIKEKFGGLRFYAGTMVDELQSMDSPFNRRIREAESESFRTCEITGKPGVLMVRGFYYRTLAPETAPDGFEIVNELDSKEGK